jgi:hypothetical protein
MRGRDFVKHGAGPAVHRSQRQRETNYGDAQRVDVDGVGTLFTMHNPDSSEATPLLVTVECVELFIPPAAVGTFDFRPFVRLSWGNGAGSVDGDFEATQRQRIPIVASSVDASCFIKALPLAGGTGVGPPVVPVGAFARFRGFVAPGTDGAPLFPSQWVTQFNAATGVLAKGQSRLALLRAFAAAHAVTVVPYFLLFDQATAPVPGDIPVDGMPLTVAGPVGAALGVSGPLPGILPQGQTRAYTRGIAWGISSTPFVFTADPDGLVAFVAAEIAS